jgi:putative lipoic acid-binding regulatory protein
MISSKQVYPLLSSALIKLVLPVPGPPVMTTFFGGIATRYSSTKVIIQHLPLKLVLIPYICKKIVMDPDKAEAFYSRLKAELLRNTSWPADYLYKFIVPTDPARITQIQDIFDNTGAVIVSKQSRKGKYTSLSITVHLNNPDEVIEKYKEVGKVEGVISL